MNKKKKKEKKKRKKKAQKEREEKYMIKNRYDFMILFDVENGNPNGDPDANGAPRVDIETGHGLVSDVCIKRKIRNYVELMKKDEFGYKILIKNDKSLNTKFSEAYEELGINEEERKNSKNVEERTKKYMCEKYWDVRMFGAVMSTGNDPCGIVKGPVQFSFGKTISPVFVNDITITRMARTTEEKQNTGNLTEMGKKYIIPYGLYAVKGYVSANIANCTTDISEEDIELLWEAILNMFENDRSAMRGYVNIRKLIIFKHDSEYGNCTSAKLFDQIKIEELDDIPRKFSDYEINIGEIPEGVELIVKD